MSSTIADTGRLLGRVSPQRWSMSFAAMLAAVGAPIATGAVGGSPSLFAVVLIGAIAGLSVVRPAAHTALGVFVVAIWHWLAVVDERASPWVMLVAGSLWCFHALVALMATTPPTATIDPVTMRRWAVRSAAVLVTIPATWLVVVAFDRRSGAGSVGLTALALVVAATLAVGLRSALPRSSN